ncbi:hypothetical protein EB796_010522 [Bugula neritina]|uniref:Uncharacterized protein n=1 Tax=Bugula neritina TaxID=10212 RepID=A0A7J7JZP0_BUGNE|nr:hypothetical protein EB796_010522 [Bugula neritina]
MDQLDRAPSNTGIKGRWVFEVASGIVRRAETECINWFLIQARYNFPYGLAGSLAVPCPCNKFYALYDQNFYYDPNDDCAYSFTRKWQYSIFQGWTSYFQKCCYDRTFGALKTDPAEAGYPIANHKLINPRSYESQDLLPFLHCCTLSDFCPFFRIYRPVDDCLLYRPPKPIGGFGDPHMFTVDGFLYTFNPVGEFWMIKSDNFTMQARMVLSTSETTNATVPATQFGAFAMQSILDGNFSDAVHVETNSDRSEIEVRVGGLLISSRLQSESPVYRGEGVTVRLSNSTYIFSFDSGFSFEISLRVSVLSVQSFIPESMKGRIKESESIFWYPFGFTSASYTDLNFEPLFLNDLDTSNIDISVCDGDMLCEFDIFMTNDTRFGVETLDTKRDVEEKVKVLGTSVPFILGMSSFNATVSEPVTAIYSSNYTGNDTVTLYVLSKPDSATFEYTGIDTDYNFTWIPEDLSVYQSDSNNFSIEFIAVTSDNLGQNVSISPVFEVSVRLSPLCQNGLSNFNKLAPRDSGDPNPNFGIVECDCDPGYVGSTCDEDFDGCSDNLCDDGTCIDVPADEFNVTSGVTYTCNITECKPGYGRKNISGVVDSFCSDIDECLSSNNPCVNSDCSNFPGSFECQCRLGFRFNGSSTEVCVNIDECEEGIAPCEQVCMDTEGSFFCSCNDGYLPNTDGISCTADNNTALLCASLNCSFACNTTSSLCICPRGQILNATDGTSCDSINECEGSNVCDVSSGATCVDLDIGYECKCPEYGYQPLVNNNDPCQKCIFGSYGLKCNETCVCGDRARECDHELGCTNCNPGWKEDQCAVDIDECVEGTDRCGPLATCTNTNGSYLCSCPEGYHNLNSTHCENIDECATTSPCSNLARCDDTSPGYTCTCQSGLTGSGLNCADIDECQPVSGDSPCVALASCTNEFGSFRCDCNAGFSGDGKVNGTGCVDDNECQRATNACPFANSKCLNTPGSYNCLCIDGYELGADFISCLDINECTSNTFNCTLYETEHGFSVCNNLNGSYSCDTECDEGYLKTPISGTEFFTCEQSDECQAEIFPCSNETESCQDTDGSYECNCLPGFERNLSNETCFNTDECTAGTDNCTDVPNGRSDCVDTFGSFECKLSCNSGFMVSNDGTACENIDECEMGFCDATTQNCNDTEGSYSCTCKDGYEESVGATSCSDINECLGGLICGNGTQVCQNLPGSYNCSCNFGWEGENCDIQIETASFIEIQQRFILDFNTDWLIDTSPARREFNSLMSEALAPLFNSILSFLGVNIQDVSQYVANNQNGRKKRAIESGADVLVTYQAAYGSAVDEADAIHRALDYLVMSNYLLLFNGTNIEDQRFILVDGIFNELGDITCDTVSSKTGNVIVDCQGQGTCTEDEDGSGYPMCMCDIEFTGYNCDEATGVTEKPGTNLLALWISVAVAGALLVGGLLACSLALIYQRRKRSKPKVHRYSRPFSGGARGPAIFNPSGRMPTEAFNYQFPVGSVRDDQSDSTSSSSGTVRTQRTEGHVGSTVPFAPRWPRAYYAQLGDPDDN